MINGRGNDRNPKISCMHIFDDSVPTRGQQYVAEVHCVKCCHTWDFWPTRLIGTALNPESSSGATGLTCQESLSTQEPSCMINGRGNDRNPKISSMHTFDDSMPTNANQGAKIRG